MRRVRCSATRIAGSTACTCATTLAVTAGPGGRHSGATQHPLEQAVSTTTSYRLLDSRYSTQHGFIDYTVRTLLHVQPGCSVVTGCVWDQWVWGQFGCGARICPCRESRETRERQGGQDTVTRLQHDTHTARAVSGVCGPRVWCVWCVLCVSVQFLVNCAGRAGEMYVLRCVRRRYNVCVCVRSVSARGEKEEYTYCTVQGNKTTPTTVR